MEVNKYQTALTDDLIKSLTKEEYENLFDYINNVPFIQSLISPDRKYARDLPRKDGRIIVDVCHPHIWRIWNILGQQVIIIKSMDVIQN